jgi:hypothetical protein
MWTSRGSMNRAGHTYLMHFSNHNEMMA